MRGLLTKKTAEKHGGERNDIMEREIDRERQIDRETATERERQTDIQTDRQSKRQVRGILTKKNS